MNFLWSILFFRFGLFRAAAVLLALLNLAVLATARRFAAESRTAARLLIPYRIWLLFTLYLNLGAAALN